MGRRVRHLNPAHVDAVKGQTCLDSRFVPGVSVGSPVETWSSRSGGGHSYTQATAGARPTLTAAAQGGQPGVSFASANSQFLIRTGTLVSSTQNPYTIFSCSSQGNFNLMQSSSHTVLGGLVGQFALFIVSGNVFSIINAAPPLGTQVLVLPPPSYTGVFACGRNGATTLFSRTSPNGTATGATNANVNINTEKASSSISIFQDVVWLGLAVAAGAITDALRNRIMHHYGYSFKFAL